jgi:hypothetical protein
VPPPTPSRKAIQSTPHPAEPEELIFPPASMAYARSRPKKKSKRNLILGILGCVSLLFLACGGTVTFAVYQIRQAVRVKQEEDKQAAVRVKQEEDKQAAVRVKQEVDKQVADLDKQIAAEKERQDKQAAAEKKEPNSKPPDSNPPINPRGGGNPPAGKGLDVAYIPANFNAAIVIHPARLLQSKSPLLPPAQTQEMLLGEAIQATGIDPRQIERAVLLIEPFPGGPPPVGPPGKAPNPKGRPNPPGGSNVLFFPAGIVRFAEPMDGNKILSGVLKEVETGQAGGKSYFRSKTEKMAQVPLAGFVVDPQTILLAPEPTLKKMLTARNIRSPLIDRLRQLDLDHDITGIFVVGQLKPALAELKKQKDIPPQFAGLKDLDRNLEAISFTLDLNGDNLLQLVLHGPNDAAAQSLEQLARNALSMGQLMYGGMKADMQKQLSKELPPEVSSKLLRLTDQIEKGGIEVTRQGKQVSVTLKKPRDLDAP